MQLKKNPSLSFSLSFPPSCFSFSLSLSTIRRSFETCVFSDTARGISKGPEAFMPINDETKHVWLSTTPQHSTFPSLSFGSAIWFLIERWISSSTSRTVYYLENGNDSWKQALNKLRVLWLLQWVQLHQTLFKYNIYWGHFPKEHLLKLLLPEAENIVT